MAAVTVKSEIWAYLLSFQASFPPFQGLIRYFLLTSMHVSNFEIFCIWPKIGQISFFSTILYYNLTNSPTHFIFGVYTIWGVPNFVLVFEKKSYRVFQSYTHLIFLIFEVSHKKININPEASFHIVSLVVNFANDGLYELMLKKIRKILVL